MAVTFTESQQRAIDTTGCNILVSAAAGSGKTAVLTERIVNKVCDESHPVDIDRLLVVTFTRAAAAEMRERIAGKINERLREHPESEHIQRQATLIYNAQITTIDSFCQFILKNHFNEIGLDPAFRVADDAELKMLKQDTLEEMLEEYYDKAEERFLRCVEFFCPGKYDTQLEEYILNLYEASRAEPWPEEWLAARRQDYGETPFEDTAAGKYLLRYIQNTIRGWVADTERLLRICEEPDGPYMYGAALENDAEQLRNLCACDQFDSLAKAFGSVEFSGLARANSSVNSDKKEYVQKTRNGIKNAVGEWKSVIFAMPAELAAAQNAVCHEMLLCLVDLTEDFAARLAEKKTDKRLIDFSDMEHFALNILVKKEDGKIVPSDVARDYRQHFEEILIDEYQDSNRVQETLLAAVSGEEDGRFNRFMVGDVKQSIYSFRLARPELFREKYETYTKEDSNCVKIDLSSNFRSRSQVVDSVNDIFSQIMSRDTGGITYDEDAALHMGASYPENDGCETEFLLADSSDEENSEDAKQLEAAMVANRIRELKKNYKVTEKDGTLREVKYSDMVILFRTNQGWDDVFKKELEAQNIPVYTSSRTGYFGASEVQQVLSYLHIVDNPLQEIPMYGALISVFGGFTEEEIAQIRTLGKDNLYHLLCRAAEEDVLPACKEKCTGFLETLREFRACQRYMPIKELLTAILKRFDYINYVTALPAGSKRKANVEMLFTRASEFEQTSYFGLFHFLHYIEQLEAKEVDYGEAEILDENADVVRIMSIHKSKGLEFPVTFLCGTAKKFNTSDTSGNLIIDSDLGIGMTYVDAEHRTKNSTLRKFVISKKLMEEAIAEEMRILYVAVTRAKEKLILTGTVKKAAEVLEQAKNNASGALSFSEFVSARKYLDFILPTLVKSRIEVKTWNRETDTERQIAEKLSLLDRRKLLLQAPDEEILQTKKRLLERLDRPYSHPHLEGLYTKTTVSELKIAAMADKDEAAFHTFEEKEVVPYIPAFRKEEESVGGTMRGNAYHRTMELMPLKELFAEYAAGPYEQYAVTMQDDTVSDTLREFLQNEVQSERLEKAYADIISVRKIQQFLCSELGYRMVRADINGKLYREQPFVLGVKASRLKEKFGDEETVLIQGIIDVFFEEEDGIVLLDYKTDRIESMQALWERYETQLDYYGEAITKLCGKAVKERYLYSFSLEKY